RGPRLGDGESGARLVLPGPEPELVLRRRREVLLGPRGGALGRAAGGPGLLWGEPDAALAGLVSHPSRRLSGAALPVAAHLGRLLRRGRVRQRGSNPARRCAQAIPGPPLGSGTELSAST